MSIRLSSSRSLTYLWSLSRGQRLPMLLCCLTGMGGVAISLLFIYFTKLVIDSASSGQSFVTPAVATGCLLLLQLACGIAG